MRTGIANLPLHWGFTPRWLFDRMTRLAREISTAIVSEFGPKTFLKRIADPFWFQAFGCVLGFDWHSSGLTTTVCGALKEGIKSLGKDLGFFVVGGKGKTSRKTPFEIMSFAEKFPIKNPENLVNASKMAAKVDTVGVQDGFDLYHHNFFFTCEGDWAVVQQGMNVENCWARRYHWLSFEVSDFVCEPHFGICSNNKNTTLNLVAKDSAETRNIVPELAAEKPYKLVRDLKKLQNLKLSKKHRLFLQDLKPKSIEKVLLKTYEKKPKSFETLLSMKGVGAKTIRALALISELIWGTKVSYKDPAKFSFAHGGKDGYPYPVNRDQYDKSIEILKKAVEKAKIGQSEKMEALKKLSK